MRLIKLFGISFVVFFLLLLAFTSLIPSTVRISRAIDIQASKSVIWPYLKEESKWPEWNRWMQQSPDTIEPIMVLPLPSSDSVLSFRWNVAERKMNSSWAIYEIRGGTTTVQWYFDFKLSWYPWEKLGSIVYDQQLGPTMEESLNNLKILVESNH